MFDDAVQASSWAAAHKAWAAYAATWAGLPVNVTLDGAAGELPDPQAMLENLELIQAATVRAGARGKRILLTRPAHR